MISAGENSLFHPSSDGLRILEVFATQADVPFDRVLAARALSEASRAIPGDGWATWSRHLIEVGETLNLRIRSIECSLKEAMSFVKQGIPVVTYAEDAEGELSRALVHELRGRSAKVLTLDDAEEGSWIRIRELRDKLGIANDNSRCLWLICQPALSCQLPTEHSSSAGNLPPVAPSTRLLGLLKPEKRDLWVLLVFSAVIGLLTLASPVAVEALVNTVAFGRYLQPVVILAILLFVFLAFAAAMRALITYVVEVIQRRLFIRVVEDLAYRLPRVQQAALDKHHGPELVNRFFDIVSVQKSMAMLLLDGIAIILQTTIGMAVLAVYHPYLMVYCVILLALIVFTIFVLGRGAIKTSIKESKAKYSVAGWLEELARHPTAFKLHGGTQFALDRADQLAFDWLTARQSHFRIVMRQTIFALSLQAIAATMLLGLGGWLVILGELSLGQLVAAELIIIVIVRSFAKLGKYMESIYDLLASVDKLGVLFDLPIEAHDKLFHLSDELPAAIEVREVSCRVGKHTVIKNFSMDLSPGESVALVGPPGSGKSILVDLLAGIRFPSLGHVELDGIDVRELRPDSLREHLAVSRTVEVFQGSIDENVHLGRSNISARDVRQSLETVDLLEEILKLPEGLNSRLQTNGAPLSGSQAARLMLARAIVGRPRLLLIDGTLDALSDDIAIKVLKNLASKDAPWTLLVTTGRQALVEACDRRVMLGEATASGLSWGALNGKSKLNDSGKLTR